MYHMTRKQAKANKLHRIAKAATGAYQAPLEKRLDKPMGHNPMGKTVMAYTAYKKYTMEKDGILYTVYTPSKVKRVKDNTTTGSIPDSRVINSDTTARVSRRQAFARTHRLPLAS